MVEITEPITGTESKRKSEAKVRGDAVGNETTKVEDSPANPEETGGGTWAMPTTSLVYKEVDRPDVTDLLERLDSDELTALRMHFYEKKVDEKIKEPKGSAHPRFRGFKLLKDEFLTAIESVLETKDYEEAAGNLFDRLVKNNAEEHKGFLWWEQILDELIDFMSEKTKSRPSNIVKESFCSLHTMPHCRRETIVRVVPVETSTSFCFVVVSKYGKVGIYDWSLSLLEQYEVRLSTQIATTAGGEVRRTTWVTDALYMADAATLLVAASDRSLHFYSTTGLVCVPVYHISGLPNTPTCLHYTLAATTEDQSMLLVGDDHGSISTVYFQQPHYALFRRTSNDALDKYFWKELGEQKAWVIITMDHGIHKDEITRVEYFSDNNTVVSCSNDPNTTLVIRYIVGRRAPYVFKVSRGVRCFHLDRPLRLLATGGKDSVLRLWNPIIPRHPVVSLFGHKTSIVDVRILRHINVVLSISKDTVLKVWDIAGQTCMQSLPLLFPVHGALARVPEFGVQSFYPGPVSCKQAFLPSKLSTKAILSPRLLSANTSSSGLADKSTHNVTVSNSGQSVPLDGLRPSGVNSEVEQVDKKTSSGKAESVSVKINMKVSTYTIHSTLSRIDTESDPKEDPGPALTKIRSTTLTQYTSIGSEDAVSCVGSPWTRMEVLLVCCNYVVILQLSERELEEGEDKRVGDSPNPPLRNQDPAVPSPWLTVDPALLAGLSDIDNLPRGEDVTPSPVLPAVLGSLQKSLGDEMTQDFLSLASSCLGRGTQQTDLRHVRTMVEQCAPHLALGTKEVEQFPFPVPKAHEHRGRRKADDSYGKKTQTVIKTSVVADESDISFSPLGTGGTTTTTTTSNSTQRSNTNRM